MRVSYDSVPENDSAWIRLTELPPLREDEGDWDFVDMPFIVARVDVQGVPRFYEITGISALVDESGKAFHDPSFEDPPYHFEIEESPGRSFTLSELIVWIYSSRSKGVTLPHVMS